MEEYEGQAETHLFPEETPKREACPKENQTVHAGVAELLRHRSDEKQHREAERLAVPLDPYELIEDVATAKDKDEISKAIESAGENNIYGSQQPEKVMVCIENCGTEHGFHKRKTDTQQLLWLSQCIPVHARQLSKSFPTRLSITR